MDKDIEFVKNKWLNFFFILGKVGHCVWNTPHVSKFLWDGGGYDFSRAKEAIPKVLLKELTGDSFAREKKLSVRK